MRNATVKINLVVGLLVLMAGVSAKAQTNYRAHIPFDFTIGEKSFEAGDYSIQVARSQTSHKIIVVRSKKGAKSFMMPATLGADLSKVRSASLVFDRRVTQNSLARISTPSFAADLPKPKAAESFGLNQKRQQEIIPMSRNN